MKTLHIQVTEDDIKQGIKGKCDGCPIVLAINRQLMDNCFAYVNGSIGKIYVKSPFHQLCVFSIPIVAYQFIAAFDSDRNVGPFSFDIELPSYCVK